MARGLIGGGVAAIAAIAAVALAGCGPQEGRAPGDCTDGADNDADGTIDCLDESCFGAPVCAPDEVDEDGCVVAGSRGTEGAPGVQWLEVPGFSDAAPRPEWRVVVWAPGDYDGSEPLPLGVFVTRNVPPEERDLMNIFEDFIGMDELVRESGGLAAVILPGRIGSMGQEVIGWQLGVEPDESFFAAALDRIEAAYNVNRARMHLFGSHRAGGYATHFSYFHADRIASTANQAGFNPFNPWPVASTWLRPVAGMFIHDPRDEFQTEAQIEDSAAMFEEAGAVVERFYDYQSDARDGHHDWKSSEIFPRLAAFQADQCVGADWL